MEDPPASRPRGRQPKPRCGANAKTTGQPCKRGAGAGTTHPGWGLCSNHGGSSPGGAKQAERIKAETEAAAAVVRFALDMTAITPGEALLREVRRSGAMVEWYAYRVNQLPESDLTWGITKQTVRQDAEGAQTVEVERQARQHILVVLLREERLLLTKVAAEAARSGIEERLTRQVELEGALMVRLLNAVLGDPELGLTALQRAVIPNVVPRHLRAIGGES
jgi:hypothetical protein